MDLLTDLPLQIAPQPDTTGISRRATPLQSDLLSPLLRAQQPGKKAQPSFGFEVDNLPLFASESR